MNLWNNNNARSFVWMIGFDGNLLPLRFLLNIYFFFNLDGNQIFLFIFFQLNGCRRSDVFWRRIISLINNNNRRWYRASLKLFVVVFTRLFKPLLLEIVLYHKVFVFVKILKLCLHIFSSRSRLVVVFIPTWVMLST